MMTLSAVGEEPAFLSFSKVTWPCKPLRRHQSVCQLVSREGSLSAAASSTPSPPSHRSAERLRGFRATFLSRVMAGMSSVGMSFHHSRTPCPPPPSPSREVLPRGAAPSAGLCSPRGRAATHSASQPVGAGLSSRLPSGLATRLAYYDVLYRGHDRYRQI